MDSIKIFLILFISSINSVKGQYLKFYSNNLELDYRNYNVYIIHSDSACQKLNVLNEQSYLLPDDLDTSDLIILNFGDRYIVFNYGRAVSSDVRSITVYFFTKKKCIPIEYKPEYEDVFDTKGVVVFKSINRRNYGFIRTYDVLNSGDPVIDFDKIQKVQKYKKYVRALFCQYCH